MSRPEDVPDDEPSLPPPRERPRRRRAPARIPLTRERIVDAAFTVLDREGYDGLSMRQVAGELGVAVSALYAHVQNKEELLELMCHRLFDGYEPPAEPGPEHWREQVKDFARHGLRRLMAHRDMARIAMQYVPFTPEPLPHVERLLAIFRTAGLPDEIAAIAGDLLSTYMKACALEAGIWRQRLTDGEATSWEDVKSYFAELPADRFPHLTAPAHLMVDGSGDHRFELGLEIIMRGLASYLERP